MATFIYKCKYCTQEFSEPDLAHTEDHFKKFLEEIPKSDPGSHFDMIFKTKWKGQ